MLKMPKGCHSQAAPYKNRHLLQAEKKHTRNPQQSEPQLRHSHRPLKKQWNVQFLHWRRRKLFPSARPLHSCLYKESWLQSAQRGNSCCLPFSALPHLQCVPWQQILILQITEGERTEEHCHQQCLPLSHLQSLSSAGDHLSSMRHHLQKLGVFYKKGILITSYFFLLSSQTSSFFMFSYIKGACWLEPMKEGQPQWRELCHLVTSHSLKCRWH